jgi:hypothetical protein
MRAVVNIVRVELHWRLRTADSGGVWRLVVGMPRVGPIRRAPPCVVVRIHCRVGAAACATIVACPVSSKSRPGDVSCCRQQTTTAAGRVASRAYATAMAKWSAAVGGAFTAARERERRSCLLFALIARRRARHTWSLACSPLPVSVLSSLHSPSHTIGARAAARSGGSLVPTGQGGHPPGSAAPYLRGQAA